jgi:DNA repair protein RadC
MVYADAHPLRYEMQQQSDYALVQEAFGYQLHCSESIPPLGELFGLHEANESSAPDPVLQRQAFACSELMARALAQSMKAKGIEMTSPKAVSDYLQLRLSSRNIETFSVIWLDSQHRLIGYEELFHGTLSQTSVYPREVVKGALLCQAAAVILAHNHPSGSASPSSADKHLTQTLKAALALVDVHVLDHFIVTSDRTSSMAEMGLV